jgi:hypothetical protein
MDLILGLRAVYDFRDLRLGIGVLGVISKFWYHKTLISKPQNPKHPSNLEWEVSGLCL